MNMFEMMINDIFQCNDFCEFALVNGSKQIKVIVYEMDTNTLYTEFGVDDGVSFTLSCKNEDYQPQKGDIIKVRKQEYKVNTFSLDSFGLCYNITLKSLNSR